MQLQGYLFFLTLDRTRKAARESNITATTMLTSSAGAIFPGFTKDSIPRHVRFPSS